MNKNTYVTRATQISSANTVVGYDLLTCYKFLVSKVSELYLFVEVIIKNVTRYLLDFKLKMVSTKK